MHRDYIETVTKSCCIPVCVCLVLMMGTTIPAGESWLHYGGSLKGDRYVSPSSITPDTVNDLSHAWTYQTGDTSDGSETHGTPTRFVATPILIRGKLIFTTGFNRIIALDAATGEEIWVADPKVDHAMRYSEGYTARGVAVWVDSDPQSDLCQERVYLGTFDARLTAIDANTGQSCTDFGDGGEVNLAEGIRGYRKSDYGLTSPPTVVGDLVVVGSVVGDNGAAELEPGVVRAYNARNGALVWQWDPIPRSEPHPGSHSWPNPKTNRTGAANVWSVMSADAERDLVFLPTTSPSPDFYGGLRLGDNAFANSIVALRASTGEFIWGYQTVRHDLWDYDNAAQPLLFEHVAKDGKIRPAVAQATKTGFVFVFDRETGEPLHPIEERTVPQSDVPGEQASKKQPFPKLRLHDTDARPLPLWVSSEEHGETCRKFMAGIRYEGIFTPPSLEGTLLYPGNVGGTNWGSMAYDKQAQIGYTVVNHWPTIVKLIPRDEYRAATRKGTLNTAPAQFTSQTGTPYGMSRFDLHDQYLPCFKGPWSTLVAVDLNLGSVIWEIPVGQVSYADREPEAADWGSLTIGGPMVTSGGVVFVATMSERMLVAYDGSDGERLWSALLPAEPHSTPMGYRHVGIDYVVVTLGGNLADGEGRGDHVVAYRLASTNTP